MPPVNNPVLRMPGPVKGDGVSYTPSLAFLQRVIHPQIRAVTATLFKVSASPSSLFHLTLRYAHDGIRNRASGPQTLILKRIAPDWPDDPHGHDREVNFYTALYPALALNHGRVYFAGQEPGSDYRLVIMEDMAHSHRFPLPTHAWNNDEIRKLLRAYAHFHTRGHNHVPAVRDAGWLFPRHEERVRATAEMLPRLVEAVVQTGRWSPLPAFSRLLERTLADMERWVDAPVTLLHGDVYPPNAGIPYDPARNDVILLDWEMLSCGLAEMDLAYMFCQPYRSHRFIHKAEALDYYWTERSRLEGMNLSHIERAHRQRYADTLLVLWLIPVAHRMALAPYPADSPVRHFWDSNFQVLNDHLLALCHEC